MARVVVGGLVTSTLITLVFIPMVYMTVEELAERVKGRRERAAAGTPDGLEPAPSAGD
jgi:HAE1 family hydrophobic/amphiphilic exporter-1